MHYSVVHFWCRGNTFFTTETQGTEKPKNEEKLQNESPSGGLCGARTTTSSGCARIASRASLSVSADVGLARYPTIAYLWPGLVQLFTLPLKIHRVG